MRLTLCIIVSVLDEAESPTRRLHNRGALQTIVNGGNQALWGVDASADLARLGAIEPGTSV
ncbi:hypothetical protein [Polaromonas sp. AET17H-212]|uniref:hypothetical protein n=1 Tax=Polaromonas sp. AET17H-212 TaxID=1977061 RepID=UPI001142179B|nr:hypothetical protein [Polaromonas sp. AET17H-212]